MKHTLLALAFFAVAPMASPALASDVDAGFYATLGINVLDPGTDERSSSTRPVLGLGYAFDDTWSAEINAPLHAYHDHVSVDGVGRVASFHTRPVELSGLYHFNGWGETWSPYVGLGYAWSRTSDDSGRGPLAGVPVSIDNAHGPLARVGVDWRLDSNWFARADATYLDLDTHAHIDGMPRVRMSGNTWQYGVALGYRF